MVTRVLACGQAQAFALPAAQPAAPQPARAQTCEVRRDVSLAGPLSSVLKIRQPPPTTLPVPSGVPGPNQYDTAGGTRVTAVALAEYEPETSPRPLVPRDRKLDRYLRRFDSGAAHNAENMDRDAVWSEIQQWQSQPTSVQALADLGVTDLAHLSPRQALQVATLIAQDVLFYDRELATDGSFSFAGIGRFLHIHAVLRWPAERFFSEGGATCREYADVVHAVFEVLKERQDPETSQLINSYMKLPTTYDHVWNALYTVQPSGEALVTQVDASWTDTGETGRLGNIDHTFGVRDYWRQLALLEGTGKRPLAELVRRFQEGYDHRDHTHRRQITARSMRRNGGSQALVRAFDALPEPLQLLALQRMDRRVQRMVIEDRAARGLETRTEEPAQH